MRETNSITSSNIVIVYIFIRIYLEIKILWHIYFKIMWKLPLHNNQKILAISIEAVRFAKISGQTLGGVK